MPLVYQQNINENTRLAVWHIAEPEAFFLNSVPLQKEITHPHKRLQHLAGRYLLTELFPGFPLELIRIADTKKPFLPNDTYHFSISHCADYAAVIVSSANRVGVDIEVVSQKVERIGDKFLSRKEKHVIHELLNEQPSMTSTQLATLIWSIKESMFKWYGLGGVDFKEHLHIDKITVDTNQFMAECHFMKDANQSLKAMGLLFNGNVLTWLFT